jgi:hypothetical protein
VNLSEEMAHQLSKKVETVLFIVSEFAFKNPNSDDLRRFAEYVHNSFVNDSSMTIHSLFSVLSSRRLRGIAEDRCLPDHKFPEFFNSDEKLYAINSLENKLDSAVRQVLSVCPPYD